MTASAVGFVLLLVVSAWGAATTGSAPSPSGPVPVAGTLGGGELPPFGGLAPINSTLTLNVTSHNLSSDFFGTTVNNEVHLLRGEAEAVNATPAHVLIWPGAMAGEDYDPLHNIHYDTSSGTPVTALTSEAQFVAMCKAIRCTTVMQVPAEIDSPAYAEEIVNYTEVNLSFHPAYWMIGNEPELWYHWQVPWKDWPTTYTTGPTPTQFGQEVVAYVKAIRNVDNSTPILGLPASGCTCGSYTFAQWIAGVLKVTGSKIQAVAFHEYPAGWLGTGDGSLLDFYKTLQGAAGIPVRMVAARQAVESSCPGCNVSVFISELGAALSYSAYGQYADGFSGALSIASQLAQAADDNLTNVDLFATELGTTNSWFTTTGYAHPDYTLYTQVLDHLGPQSFAVNFSGLGYTVYGLATLAPNDQGRQDLLVLNDNITHAVSFVPRFPGPSTGAPVAVWTWNGSIHASAANATTWVEPYTPGPVLHEYPEGLPARFTLPPQSLALFESYPAHGTYVHLLESGVPLPTPWYPTVGSHVYETTANNLSLLLPTGASYPLGGAGIPLPIGGKEFHPSEQLGAFASGPLLVSGNSTNATLTFLPQWRITATASPAVGGSVTPRVGWWNVSAPLNLTATPHPGYAFLRWSGWGRGSYNGTGRTVTIVPGGPVEEKALFVVGQTITLVASGLPSGTPWAVTIRGFTTSATGNVLTTYEPNGTFGFSVQPVPGYRILPRNGSFTVFGGPVFVDVRFQLITPPQPTFDVTFDVTGLPAGLSVPITVRNSTAIDGSLGPALELINGSYAYHVGYVPGYHLGVPHRTFRVSGGPLVVEVPFVPTVYDATWEANGSEAWMNWSVSLNGTPMVAGSAWLSTDLANGTYGYAVALPSNFSVTPRTGLFVINGSGSVVHLTFALVEFAAWFQESGLPPARAWSVRLGAITMSSTDGRSSLSAPNGTYTFDVHPPSGYYALPSHGNLTVAGGAPLVVLHFLPVSNKPSAALVAALSMGAISVSVWIGASIAGGFVALRWLRRRGG